MVCGALGLQRHEYDWYQGLYVERLNNSAGWIWTRVGNQTSSEHLRNRAQ